MTILEGNRKLIPLLKWPGGKRWLVAAHADLLPTDFKRYFEPFVGGGSVFFHLEPKRAVVSDCNLELIEAYKAIAWRRKRFEAYLQEHQQNHSLQHYYRVRKTIPADSVARAARTVYLNRTCFNGMYRVNLSGQFNVPKGTKSAVILDTDDFFGAAQLLRTTELQVADFETTIDRSSRGDFVFADPPYIVGHNDNGFVKYNDKLFKWSDQKRLAAALLRASRRGVKILATNAAHGAVESLYDPRHFTISRVERYSSIAATSDSRKRSTELIVRANCGDF